VVEAKSSGGVLGDITTHILHKADQPSDRRQDILHPSEMCRDDWCPRASYYRIRDVKAGKTYKSEEFSVGTLRIFDEGHSVHHKYQTYLREMGRLKGRWDCSNCGNKGIGFPNIPPICVRCMIPSGIVYGEVPLDAEKEHLIVGSADGWVDDLLIEIKTIGVGTLRLDVPELLRKHTHTVNGKQIIDLNALWNELDKPFKPHIKQANIYLYIANVIMGLGVDRMEFIYEFKVNQQVKNFTIKMSPRVIEPLLAKADTVKTAVVTGEPPPREFDRQDRNPCKNCAWLKECYAENPAKSESSDSGSGGRAGREGAKADEQPVRPTRTRGRALAAAQGSHVVGRQRFDDAVSGNGGVGELPRGEAHRSTNRRIVRRVRPGTP
jgi:hypothetical protein